MTEMETAAGAPVRALALSGGGFRATLFHLGVVRYLRDTGRLASVRHVSGVSGGAVMAAHLVCRWADYSSSEDAEFEDAARELVALTRRNVRGRILLAWPFQVLANLCRLVLRLLLAPLAPIPLVGWPLRGRRLARALRYRTRSDLLERKLASLFGNRDLRDVRSAPGEPAVPDLHLLATNLSQGGAASFSSVQQGNERKVVYQWEVNPGTGGHEAELLEVQCDHLPIERAVACSAAFPGVFPPRLLEAEDLGLGSEKDLRHLLTDGGVFDNLGVRMLARVARGDRTYDELLVSDAGAPLVADETADANSGLILWQLKRAVSVLLGRVGSLEKSAHRGMANDAAAEVHRGAIAARVIRFVELASAYPRRDELDLEDREQRLLASLRTDLDRFTATEIDLLAWHGQRVAQYVLDAGGSSSDPGGNGRDPIPWVPMPSGSWSREEADGGNTLLRKKVRRQLIRGQRPRPSSFLVMNDPRTYLLWLGAAVAVGIGWVLMEPWWMTRSLEDAPKWRVFDIRGQRQDGAEWPSCSSSGAPVGRSHPRIDREALCALERTQEVEGVAVLRLSDIQSQQFLEGQLELRYREREVEPDEAPFGEGARIRTAGLSSLDREENRVRLRIRQLLSEGCQQVSRSQAVGVLSLDDERVVPARLDRCRFSQALTIALLDHESDDPLLILDLAPRKFPPMVRQVVEWAQPRLEGLLSRFRALDATARRAPVAITPTVEPPLSAAIEAPDPWELALEAWSPQRPPLANALPQDHQPGTTPADPGYRSAEAIAPSDFDAPIDEYGAESPEAEIIASDSTTITVAAEIDDGARAEVLSSQAPAEEPSSGKVTVTIESVTVSDCVGWQCRLRFELWQGAERPMEAGGSSSSEPIAARYQRRFEGDPKAAGPLGFQAGNGPVRLRVVQVARDDKILAESIPIEVQLGSSDRHYGLMRDEKNDLLLWVAFRTDVEWDGEGELRVGSATGSPGVELVAATIPE
jgi:predicted acylesterase/phospholipase RssA